MLPPRMRKLVLKQCHSVKAAGHLQYDSKSTGQFPRKTLAWEKSSKTRAWVARSKFCAGHRS